MATLSDSYPRGRETWIQCDAEDIRSKPATAGHSPWGVIFVCNCSAKAMPKLSCVGYTIINLPSNNQSVIIWIILGE